MIDENKLIRVIRDFQESSLPDPLYERKYELPLQLPLNRAIVIMGPRRTGKSYLMLLTIKKLLAQGIPKQRILKINLEDIVFSDADAQDLQKITDLFIRIYPENAGKKIWLFIDEIQNARNWEKFVRSAIDRGIYVFISGSSSKLLSREIATQMRGRSLDYVVHPLDFTEFLDFKKIAHKKYTSTKEENRIINAAEEYMKFGSYPEIAIMPGMKESVLQELLDVTISRDVIERYGVRNPKIVRLLIEALANSFEFSANKFYNFLKSNGYKISKNSIHTYMQALNDAFIVYYVRNYSNSYKKREQSIPKPYFEDNGIVSISGIRDNARLLENAVFTALLRAQGYEHIFYAKGLGYDLDFVIVKNTPVKIIQVSYDISNFSTMQREFESLYSGSKHFKCDELLLITMNNEGMRLYKGKKIKILPLWKWLLSKEL